MNDIVNHPKHYTAHRSGYECIDIRHAMSSVLGDAFKYVWRDWDNLKDGPVSLKKAIWYLEYYLSLPQVITMLPTKKSQQAIAALENSIHMQDVVLLWLYRADMSGSIRNSRKLVKRAIFYIKKQPGVV